jgi:hypothetical protein
MLEGKAVQMGILTKSEETLPTTLEELALYKQQGKDPNKLLWHLVRTRYNNQQGFEALRRWSSGASSWLQVAWLLSL